MTTRTAALAAITLTAVLALAGCAGADNAGSMSGMDHGGDSGASHSASSDASPQDVIFVEMMIPHHEQAVEMSDVLLAKDGIDPSVVALAEQIRDAQQPEIDTMRSWLEAWGAEPASTEMGGMHHSGGMMSDAETQALDEATGAYAARLFLEQMIEHHDGAIDMAETEASDGRNGDARTLAQTIVDTQTAEIETMRRLLDTL